MKLYWFQVAPNPTRVRLYVAEKKAGGAGIELDDVVIKLPKGEQKKPEFKALNPFGALPVLELDDGSTIIESLAIIDYLEELHPAPALWGEDLRSRARAREIERIVEQRLLNPLTRYIHATNSPLGLPPNPAVAEQAAAGWPSALAYLEDLLADGRDGLCGSSPTVGDCTLAAATQFARFAGVDLLPEGRYPAISDWDTRFRARPAVAEVLTH